MSQQGYETYEIGQVAHLKATFKDGLTKALADPTTVTCKVKEPDDTVTTLVYGTDAALIKESTGVYYVDVSVDQEGMHWYAFEGDGVVESRSEKRFMVKESHVF
jgi:hypothetical protein